MGGTKNITPATPFILLFFSLLFFFSFSILFVVVVVFFKLIEIFIQYP